MVATRADLQRLIDGQGARGAGDEHNAGMGRACGRRHVEIGRIGDHMQHHAWLQRQRLHVVKVGNWNGPAVIKNPQGNRPL